MSSLRTLGSLNLLDGEGNELTAVLSQPKRFALLVYLAAARPGEMHRRDTLLALFWPERDERHARNALSQSLSYLRRYLPEGVIFSRGSEEVGVSPEALEADVRAFHLALEEKGWSRALELYGGDFLRGFHVEGAAGFEEWMAAERERLREAAAGAAWSLAREQIGAGALVEAERTAQRAMDLVCTDESPVRTFIDALARAGEEAAALNFYERFSSRLREKLDLEPSPRTAKVAEDIRNGELVPSPAMAPAGEGIDRGEAAVQERTLRFDEGSTPPTEHRASLPDPEEAQVARARRRWGKAPRRYGILALPVIVAAGVWAWPKESWEPDHRLVAVAPFQNRTGDPSFDLLGANLAAGVQWTLGHSGIGEIVPFPVVEEALAREEGERDPVDVLGRNAGAGVVVIGDLFLRGDSLLVQAHCLDSRTRKTLHTIQPVMGSKADQARMAEEMEGKVAAALAQHFDTDFARNARLIPPPVKVEAYREFRRGYEVYQLGGTHEEALAHFRRAWELDPSYLAPPLRILALYSGRPGLHSQYDSILAVLESSRHRMTPFQRHYFDGLRMSAEGQQKVAYREFLAMAKLGRLEAAAGLAEMALLTNHIEKSIEAAGWLDKGNGEFLEPYVAFWQGYWSMYTYALHLAARYEKELEIAQEWKRRFPATEEWAIQAEAKARIGLGQLEELAPVIADWRAAGVSQLEAIWHLADELWVHGHRDAARRLLEGEVQRFDSDPAYMGRYNNQAMVLHRLGRDQEAHALWEAGIDLDKPKPWPWGVARIGFSAALAGDSAQASEMERLLLTLEPDSPVDEVYIPFMQAQIAAALGERDRAVRTLEEWGRSGRMLFWLNNIHRDFTLQSLLGDYPPFQELLRPKG